MNLFQVNKLSFEKYKDFITKDKYISKKEINNFIQSTKFDLDGFKDIEEIKKYVKGHNDFFIKTKLVTEKEYFDNMFIKIDKNIKLDLEQRLAILTEEDYAMIIAGAGSGKTTTMVAKVKYLIEKLKVNPKDIILISYTNKAVAELKQRLNQDFKIPVEVYTFHKFGLEVLKENNDKPISIVTNSYKIIFDYFNKKLSGNKKKLEEFLFFFINYFDISNLEMDSNLGEEYCKIIKRNNYLTLKKYNKETMDNQIEKKPLKKEWLMTNEEIMIANLLDSYNLKYDYEKPYPYLKLYLPDFTIYVKDNIYYLEHYEIKEKGNDKKYNYFENKKYRQKIAFNTKFHNKYRTSLITTYSQYKDNKTLIYHLKKELQKRGIINENNNKVIEKISTNRDSSYLNFILFIAQFLSGFKTNGFKLKEIDKFIIEYKKDERIVEFLLFFKDLYQYYESELQKNNLIDFEDMINTSYERLKKLKKEDIILNYKYIIIDEYQDISSQRFNLIKEISRLSGAKVIAVGDDWQAVFAFAGADGSLFTEFKNLMGYGEELPITNTYRNSQELIDIAGQFIMKNNNQIKKKLKAQKRIEKPIIIVNYDDHQDIIMNHARAVVNCLKEISLEYGNETSILLIGRYNFEKNQLLKSGLFYEDNQKQIKSLEFPNLKITFLTAHSSKGLGFDNVIIINGSSGVYGFPSQIREDPIMKIINIKNDNFKFAEERRLFYVALTRTKNKVYLVSPRNKPSIFIVELKKHFKVEIKNSSLNKKDCCPFCKYPLIKKGINNLNLKTLYVCSNKKELCNFKTNNLKVKENILICDKCKDGLLIVKQNQKNKQYFLGCINYKNGCNNVKSIEK